MSRRDHPSERRDGFRARAMRAEQQRRCAWSGLTLSLSLLYGPRGSTQVRRAAEGAGRLKATSPRIAYDACDLDFLKSRRVRSLRDMKWLGVRPFPAGGKTSQIRAAPSSSSRSSERR